MGRQPKSVALRVVNPESGRDRVGHRKVNMREPTPRLGVPDPPAELDPRARAEYARIVDEMRRAAPKLLTQLDDTVLAQFCEAKFQWVDIVAKINGEKRKGRPVDRFDVVMMSRFTQQMTIAGDRLGLSPAARTRLQLPDAPADEDDDF